MYGTSSHVITSEMIHHHGASLSKQPTTDVLLCHDTQQDLSLSTVKQNLITHVQVAKSSPIQPFSLQPGHAQLTWLHIHGLSFTPKS